MPIRTSKLGKKIARISDVTMCFIVMLLLLQVKALDSFERRLSHSGDEAQIFWQRSFDRHLEEAIGRRVDHLRPLRGKVDCDLLLSTAIDIRRERPESGEPGQESVRISGHHGVFGEGQIVAVERGLVGQLTSAKN